MPYRGEVLVAIMNDLRDFTIARDQHWYRIPVAAAEKWLKDSWPPRYLAFYETKVFGPAASSVTYFARVLDIRLGTRRELFPAEPIAARSDRQYYQLFLEPLRTVPQPIANRHRRRVLFIPTTWPQFAKARDISDLCADHAVEESFQLSLFEGDGSE